MRAQASTTASDSASSTNGSRRLTRSSCEDRGDLQASRIDLLGSLSGVYTAHTVVLELNFSVCRLPHLGKDAPHRWSQRPDHRFSSNRRRRLLRVCRLSPPRARGASGHALDRDCPDLPEAGLTRPASGGILGSSGRKVVACEGGSSAAISRHRARRRSSARVCGGKSACVPADPFGRCSIRGLGSGHGHYSGLVAPETEFRNIRTFAGKGGTAYDDSST